LPFHLSLSKSLSFLSGRRRTRREAVSIRVMSWMVHSTYSRVHQDWKYFVKKDKACTPIIFIINGEHYSSVMSTISNVVLLL
ncbi:hypothetical protein MKW98_004706, partial [Papaver atlanticum]